jgi:hypothetical protein
MLRLFLIDLCAASFSTLLMFGLGYAFASKVEEGFNDAKNYITPLIALGLAIWLLHRFVKARLRAGKLVGPPVLVEPDDEPLPPDDLHAVHDPPPVPARAEGIPDFTIVAATSGPIPPDDMPLAPAVVPGEDLGPTLAPDPLP